MTEIFKVSGKKFTLPKKTNPTWAFHTRPGGWVIAESSEGLRVRLMIQEIRNKLYLNLGGRIWAGELHQEQRQTQSASGASDTDLLAQFPGKVRKLLIDTGSLVKEGDSLLLVEAMKMEFAIRAPFSGIVTRVLVQEGQQVSPGDRFLDMEVEGGSKSSTDL